MVKYRQSTETEPGEELLAIDVPLGEVDNSTYDIYFSAPQVDNAEKIISRLFQSSIALKMDRLKYFVQKSNPTIEEEFIYIALDRLVGNPPFIQPKAIVDKFGRRGYLIYRNEYYIFQPMELRDETIPLQYRRQPLKIKSRFYNMDLLDSGPPKATAARRDYTLQTDVLDAAIRDIRRPIDDVFDIIRVHRILDYLILREQAYILETMINEERTGQAIAADPSEPLSPLYVVVEYLMRAALLYFVPNDDEQEQDVIPMMLNGPYTLMHILKYTQSEGVLLSIYDREKGQWIVEPYNDGGNQAVKLQKYFTVDGDERQLQYTPLLQRDPDQPETHVVHAKLNNDDKVGLFGFLSKTMSVRNQKAFEVNRTIIGKLEKYYTEYPDRSELATAKFKVISFRSQTIKLTKSGLKSGKTQVRGMVCTSIVSDNKADIIAHLKTHLHHVPPEVEEKALTMGGSDCPKIDTWLRILDYYQVDGKQWYLSPFETEIHMPRAGKGE